MPPRRSARSSLPTPANSHKAESTTSSITPPANKTSSRSLNRSKSGSNVNLQDGLMTPNSMDNEGSEGSFGEMMDEDDVVSVNEDLESTTRRSKRKADDEDDTTLNPSPASSTTGSSSKKLIMESVLLPSRRSKLSTEKTTSADNLTLGSPAPKRGGRSRLGRGSSPADIIKAEEEEAIESESKPTPPSKAKSTRSSARTTKGGKPDNQPFNVGTFSSVRKETIDDLALDSDDSANDSDGSYEAAKPKAKGKRGVKSRVKAKKEDTESEFEEDFAMNSDDEEKQLKKAIQESIGADEDSKMSSPASSSRGARGGRGRGKAQTLGGRANNSQALRRAAAKAAETRAAHARGEDTPFSAETGSTGATSDGEFKPPTGLSTPKGSALPSGSAAPMDYQDFSDESELSDFSSDLSDDSDAPKKKGKGKGKKGKGKFGVGRTLGSGEAGAPMDPGLWDDQDVTTAEELKAKRKRDKANHEEKMKPIRAAEKALKRELGRKLTNGERNFIRLKHHHEELADVWGDLAATIKPVKPVPMEAHPSLKLTLLPFQKESLYWMKKQEEGPWKGGMLADEMGMGKTIQTIALLLSEPRRKPSLVVAPVVALMQWKHEIETHAEGFKVCLWHGQGRMKANELKKFDVVLSSYGTLEAAFRRQQRGFKRGNVFVTEKSPMHEFQWFRVVLDEAHNIKERSTNAAKAAFALDAEYKWCLSGTPLQNRVGELYSLVRFLGADPFSHYFCKKCDCKSLHWSFKDKRHCDQCGHKPMDHVCFWNTEILTPIAKYGIENGNPGHTAFKKLKILLDRMMLRRTKLERADDLGLPPRTIVVRRDFFSPAEAELYKSLFTDAKRTFATYVEEGVVLNNYSNIFSLITRMRQMACHPDLVLKSKNSALVQGQAEGTVCRLCNDQAEDAIISACKHVFDRECIRQYLEVQQLRGKKPECPVCHIEISIDLEAEALDLEAYAGPAAPKAKQGILSRLNLDNWRSSSKLEALVEELEKLRNKDCTIKSLVFSQFVSFLDLIAFRLQRAGFNICRLEGGMTPQQRDATIQHFMKNTEVTVFLISLKAGGVALNLTEASMVFMMDSWWNPSVEYQAMDRIHRLGQKRPVKVVKLVVQDSIEEQIVGLQAKKLAMTEAALSTDPDAALGKLTVEDLGFLFKM